MRFFEEIEEPVSPEQERRDRILNWILYVVTVIVICFTLFVGFFCFSADICGFAYQIFSKKDYEIQEISEDTYVSSISEGTLLNYPEIYNKPDDTGLVLGRLGLNDRLKVEGELINNHIPVKIGNIMGFIKNNNRVYLTKGKLEQDWVNEPVNRIWYQWDERWEDKLVNGIPFGETGCVPTSLAMSLSSIFDVTITPYDVGSILGKFYSYNILGQGGAKLANATKVIQSVYGVDTNNIPSSEVREYLEDGYDVLLSVGKSPWCLVEDYRHCILLRGLEGDKTYIKDPTRFPSDISETWYPLDDVLQYSNVQVAIK